jgi:hypothetical protein
LGAATAVIVTATFSGAATGVPPANRNAQIDGWRGWHYFSAVTAMAPDSALTVGSIDPDDGCCRAMSQAWDGTDWTYATPHLDTEGVLASVDSLSETDAWAVGHEYVGQGRSLTEHWNGHRWKPVYAGAAASVYLSDVSMVASDDVWAVGTYYWGEGGQIPVVMHWDGTTWTRLPALFDDGTLDTVTAISADDVWAVGLYSAGLWHYDGTTWTRFANPLDGYFSMSASATDDIWLSGQLAGRGFAHWDGQTWTRVDSPVLGANDGQLWDVTAFSKKDAWAVGNTYAVGSWADPDRAVIEHWNGRKWTIVPCPHSHQVYEMLTAVGGSSPTDVWAIGTYGNAPSWPHGHRFMLHWDGSAWSRYHPKHAELSLSVRSHGLVQASPQGT